MHKPSSHLIRIY